jgi:acetyl-CoA synthetase
MKSVDPRVRSWEDYGLVYSESLKNGDAFWEAVADYKLKWRKRWSQVSECDFLSAQVKWYPGAELNVAENCLDRHLEAGLAKKIALIWVGNDLNEERILTYEELHREVCRMSNGLQALGVRKGDRIVFYLPNIPELAIGALACARIGAVHSVIFGGFSAHSIQSRVTDCGAKLIITANGTYRGSKWIDLKKNVDEAMEMGCPSVEKVVTFPRHPEKAFARMNYDLSWEEFLNPSLSVEHTAQGHSSLDPLFILYTSGSTGKPKGVLHTMGGYLTYVAYSYELVFQPKADDVYWCTADVGWITGHSYLIYGPLANGMTTLMFEGIPTHPDPGRFWQIVDRYRVSIFYSAPTAIRILASSGDQFVKPHSLKSIRTLGTVGEPINPEAWKWYDQKVGHGRAPIVDTWWQTETGGIMISPLAGISPTQPGSASFPLPGIEPRLLDDQGRPVEGPGSGALVIARSWPGQMTGVFGDPRRFYETYFTQFPGYYFTGDGATRDENGMYWITGRTDDVIKISGHRLGTAEIESACITHPAVAESGAVGVPDPITGEALSVFVVPKGQIRPTEALTQEVIQVVRKEVGALATPKTIYWIPGLPKTRSGKIMRRILRKIASGELEQLGDTSTLADPSIVEKIVKSVIESSQIKVN